MVMFWTEYKQALEYKNIGDFNDKSDRMENFVFVWMKSVAWCKRNDWHMKQMRSWLISFDKLSTQEENHFYIGRRWNITSIE